MKKKDLIHLLNNLNDDDEIVTVTYVYEHGCAGDFVLEDFKLNKIENTTAYRLDGNYIKAYYNLTQFKKDFRDDSII